MAVRTHQDHRHVVTGLAGDISCAIRAPDCPRKATYDAQEVPPALFLARNCRYRRCKAMTFGRFLVAVPLVAGVVFGFVAFALALGNGDETATAVFTALSATTILVGLILATTLPQFGRMMEGHHDD